MPRGTDDYLGRRLAKLEAEIKKLQKGRLQNSSLHGSALPVYDDDDVLKTIMGRQPDGSYGVLPRNSGHQPRPSAPALSIGEIPGTVNVEWDGGADSELPEVHGHVEVLAGLEADGQAPDLEAMDRKPWTIRDRDGGAVTITAPGPGVLHVGLRLVGADRVTRSEISEVSTITVEALVDSEAIRETLEEAQDRIDEANQRLESSMAELDEKLAAAINDRLQHSTEQPPADYDGNEGDIWRVVDSSGTVLAEYERVDGGWEERQISSEVIHNLDVGKLTAESGQFAEAVIGLIWAEAVRAKLLEAEEAIIGGAVIQDGAIDVEHLHVTESMSAAIGEFLHLQADQIDVNDLVANSALISLLEAANLVLSDEAGGRRVEMSGSGLLMTETDTGEPLMQLGLYGDDFLSLINEEGDQSVVLQRNGLVAGEVVSSETDLLVGGRELVGTAMDHPGGRDSNAVLDPFPRGILAQLERPFTEDSSTGQEITIGYLQARLQRGRLYRIKCNPFVMGAGTSGADMLVYQTTGEEDWPVMPSSSTGWSRGPQRGMPTTSGTPVLQYEALYRPETDEYFRCIFVIRRTAGSSVYFLPWSRGTAHMMIEDIGADANHTGRPMFRLASNNGDVGTSESVSVTRTPTQAQTYQASSVNATSFTAASPDPDSRYRHGYWDASFMPAPTHYMAGFRFADSTSQINGREVISAEWRVLVDAWALKTIGDSIYPGIRVDGGTLPSSMSPSSVDWLDNVEGRLPGRWASIPVPDEYLQEVIDGSAQLVLGRPSMSRRAGAATPANGVQLVFRVTQT